jgi:hypothetical protein
MELCKGDSDFPDPPTWELWLTKRERGDGFYVFTDCENTRNFCFVAAIGICVKEGIITRLQSYLTILTN